jgi:hypothetical protein
MEVGGDAIPEFLLLFETFRFKIVIRTWYSRNNWYALAGGLALA